MPLLVLRVCVLPLALSVRFRSAQRVVCSMLRVSFGFVRVFISAGRAGDILVGEGCVEGNPGMLNAFDVLMKPKKKQQENKKVKCRFCTQKFVNAGAVTMHERAKHPKSKSKRDRDSLDNAFAEQRKKQKAIVDKRAASESVRKRQRPQAERDEAALKKKQKQPDERSSGPKTRVRWTNEKKYSLLMDSDRIPK